jgi:hypothetical protein
MEEQWSEEWGVVSGECIGPPRKLSRSLSRRLAVVLTYNRPQE